MGRQSTAKIEARRRRRTTATTVSAPSSTRKPAGGRSRTTTQSAATPATVKPTRARTRAWTLPFPALRATLAREWKRFSDYPLTTYYIVLASVLALAGLGLVMVLSASSITSYDAGKGSSFAIFNKQALFAGVGVIIMFAASFVPIRWWKKLAWWALLLGVVLQSLVFVPGFGKTVKGNSNWIVLPGDNQIQPSEFLKVALAVWLGFILAQRFGRLTTFKRAMAAVLPGIVLSVGLVVVGNDLGTALVLLVMIVLALFIGRFPLKYLALLGTAAAAMVAIYIVSSENRMQRIQTLLTGHANHTAEDVMGTAWQANQGLYSLASGGWFGVGLGASREKWYWLPEAHNDFIFAIIGEELGLVGTIVVLFVLTALAFGLIRTTLRSQDIFVQVTTVALFAWLIGQSAINIAVVTGMLPVIGLPLPFVSYGGSSMVASLLAVGVILSFARQEEGAPAGNRPSP